MSKLNETITLQEKTRSDLIAKSKTGKEYSPKNQVKGKNRWERRRYSSFASSVAEYNRIDMNDVFKNDMLRVAIKVNGETGVYFVTIGMFGIIDELANQVKLNKNKLEFKCVLIALTKIFNSDDIYVNCTCEDWKYRFSYVANQDAYDSSPFPELRPANITNPDDDKGAGCKHVNLVLANIDWMYKVASVIHNYINYCKDNMENNYARYIFPKIYNMPYEQAIQMSVFDYDDQGNVIDTLSTDEETINLSNAIGKRRGQFRKDVIVNNQQKFQKKEPVEQEEDQLGLFDKEEVKEAEPLNNIPTAPKAVGITFNQPEKELAELEEENTENIQ